MSRYKSSHYQRQSSPEEFDDSEDEGDDDSDDDEEVEEDISRKRRFAPKSQNISKPENKFKFGKMSTPISGIYVLENISGGTPRFYVGKSNDIARRVNAHMSGQGGVGYLSGKTLRQVDIITRGSSKDLESWERNETLQRMYQFGIDNVRGWMFTGVKISKDQHQAAFNQICEKHDLCRRCGHKSHFQGKCYAGATARWSAVKLIYSPNPI